MSRFFIYKCNVTPAAHRTDTGNWFEGVFTTEALRARRVIDWGVVEDLKGLDMASVDDLVIAQQTGGPGWIVGIARVAGFTPPIRGKRRVRLQPLEKIGAKLRPLKEADPNIAAIPALRGGPIATLYEIGDADAQLLLDAARAAARAAAPLHGASVVLALGERRIEQGSYSTRQVWRAASSAWEDATSSGRPMPILFGDASFDSGNLFRWAIVSSLSVTREGTEVTWRDVRRLRGHDVSELLLQDGKSISRRIGKLYTVVETPAFLQRASIAHPNVTNGDGAPTFGASTSRIHDVENDPVEYELVQRRLRRHQSTFRDLLLLAYGGRCAISGTDVSGVLEAAHIDPHVNRGDNSLENGILLRSDLHALFDEGLLCIHPTALTVHLAPALATSSYRDLEGATVAARCDGCRPSMAALEERWRARVRR